MPETVTLTTPITRPSQTGVEIERITIDVKQKSIVFQWLGTNGEAGSAAFPTPAILNPLAVLQPTGAAVLTQLNTANLTANSLVKRALTLLQTNGYLPAGTVGGTPD